MSIISWNCRGLGNLRTVQDLRQMVKEKRPWMVFLMETKLRKNRMDVVRYKLGFPNLFVVDSIGKSGGLALLWGDEIIVDIQNYSHRHINGVIKTPMVDVQWKFTGFYGHPDVNKRQESWDLLKVLKQFSPNPWICIGDFNEVISNEEKWGGSNRSSSQMRRFQLALEECELSDMGFRGPKYTWSNCRESWDYIKERLDRGLANTAWCDLFPSAEIWVEGQTNSDHAVLTVSLFSQNRRKKRTRRFRYEASWEMEEGYSELISKTWNMQPSHGGNIGEN
jgi:exonuclease III